MAEEREAAPAPPAETREQGARTAEANLGGSYDVLRQRLLQQTQALAAKADALNGRRKQVFGGTELTVVGNERVRTEHNCKPAEIVAIGDLLLVGYSVYIGLKAEVTVGDVFSLHRFVQTETGYDFPTAPLESGGGFLADERLLRELKELFQYYKNANLQQLVRTDTRLLAVFQVGNATSDVKVFRWDLADAGHPIYIDNRGDRDLLAPPSHDFEWKALGREDFVQGRHPHVSVEDAVFVETVGGDLTIKIENNTETGRGILSEPVEDLDQSLDDAQFQYARVGDLYLLRVLPFREQLHRHFVFNRRTQEAHRIDAIGLSCVQLPEDHGIIFPGGTYLQTGELKLFEGDDVKELELQRVIRSPNGEDVLYVFLRKSDGHYYLLPYNLIRKEVQTPIRAHGYTLFADGKMVVFRVVTDEPTRVHPMQVWQTPFTSAEYAASTPTDGSYLAKVGNAELVRGISDAFTLRRLAERATPTRQTFEDMVATVNRMVDSYYWLGHAEVGDLSSTLRELKKTAELVVDEFEKVVAIRKRAADALEEARGAMVELAKRVRPEDLKTVEAFMGALTALRHQRGRLITLREMRYIDLAAIDELERRAVQEYDRVSAACAGFLGTEAALRPLTGQLQDLLGRIEQAEKATDLRPLAERLEQTTEGLNVLSEIAGGLQVDDATVRTRVLQGISEVVAQLNRVRATMDNRRKEVLGREGRAEFAAQFKLLSQNVESAISRADTPERCDEQLSRLMVQLEEVEGRFSELDEFVAELAAKREEIYEALSAKKQTLVEERQRRALSLFAAAERILEGAGRRARTLATVDELNAYFASDPMLFKLRDIVVRLGELGDSVKADELESRLKSTRQDALRLQRDRGELFEDGAQVLRLGRHRFSVNTQPLELTIVPHAGAGGAPALAFHLTATDYYEPVTDEAFAATREFWDQTLVSESRDVSRAEYLAATILFDAEAQRGGLTLDALRRAALAPADLLELVRRAAADRYDEGYERGVHDADAALLLGQLVSMHGTAGLLRFPPAARALAALCWVSLDDDAPRDAIARKAANLGRLRASLGHSPAMAAMAAALGEQIAAFARAAAIAAADGELRLAGQYLLEELMAGDATPFVAGAAEIALRDALLAEISRSRSALEDDLRALCAANRPGEAHGLATAWVEAFLARTTDPSHRALAHASAGAVGLLLTEGRIARVVSSATASARIKGLLGQHPRVSGGELELRLDEFLDRLSTHVHRTAPRYREYRKLRQQLVDRERERLRLDEFKPKVLTSFVRNRLINDVYLPLVGDNLAKQLGTVGETKRTDLMGMLLLVSPPGYGKTTLMEYMASQLGLVFMKVNGPSLGHGVTSLDPAEAKSATARLEVEKINLALEMGNNVMLYLDDIQHTNPELLQKFISLCDAQRRIEGVWRGRTRTYDLRGKKFCMVMAGNPYTESGERFQIPDMLANRADTYNLGDVLEGKEDLFALSYLENTLTSSPTLQPLAGRAPADVHLLIRKARGEDVPTTELSYPYSAAEIADVVAVLQHLLRTQQVLLKVNTQYILSASQDEAYRAEPKFQLQGSYRNMNKIAARVVPAMNEAELEALVDEHYLSEAQTLTTGAEHNLLKLGELRGRLDPEQTARWEEIKASFRRQLRMGGKEDDPATRVVGQLVDLSDRMEGIRRGLEEAATRGDLRAQQGAARRDRERKEEAAQRERERKEEAAQRERELAQRERAQQEAARRTGSESAQTAELRRTLEKIGAAMEKLQRPELDVTVEARLPQGITDLLDQQIALVERILNPLVLTVTRSMEEGDSMRVSMAALLDDLKRIDQQLKRATPEELAAMRAATERTEE